MSGSGGTWRHGMHSQGLGQSHPCGLVGHPHGLSLGSGLFAACGFPQHMFRVTVISSLLVSSLQLTHCTLQGCSRNAPGILTQPHIA
jgi:hypothetical protein